MRNPILFVICLFLPASGFSQLVISNNASAVSLAHAIVGSGINVSNATIDCGLNSTATFTYSGTGLGVPNGVLLTSGLASDVANPGTFFSNVQNGNNLSDPDVIAISSQARYDACLLEFDFIPVCDTLHITYVFGSEEYPRYINQYNDVFAMFLTGPNPAGGNYSSHNIATLPNGTTPVSIFTVNGGWPIGSGAANPAYYVDNYTNPNSDIAYDGFTVPITSLVAVTPCVSYHLKIAIVDAGNGKYDSGVFIRGNTFTCTTAPSSTIVATGSCLNDGTAAVAVSNYAGPSTYLWFPGGQTTSSITNLTPGNYSCRITYPGLCTTDSLTVTVTDTRPVVTPVQAATICIGQTVSLTANASGGTPGYTYAWSTGGNPVNATVSPVVNTNYSVIATDANGCSSLPENLLVGVNPPVTIQTTNAISLCESSSTTLSAVAAGGNGNYSFQWTPSAGLSDPAISNPVAAPATTTLYAVTVSDDCGSPAAASSVTITVEPLPVPSISANVLSGCVPLCVSFTDASPASCSTASWSFGDGFDTTSCNNAYHCFTTPGTFAVTRTVTSMAGCTGSVTKGGYITAFRLPDPAFSYLPNPVLIVDPAVSFTDHTADAVSWQWSFGDAVNNTSTEKNPQHLYADTGCYALQLIVENMSGCVDTLNSEICILPEFEFYAPNAFTPNNDGINEVFLPRGTGVRESDYEFIIFDRWGREIFKTSTWGEGWSGETRDGAKTAQEDTYVWLVRVYDLQHNFHQFSGRVSLIY
jgi:gliding motility-associated-like protein